MDQLVSQEIINYIPQLLYGALTSLALAFGAALTGVAIGTLLAIMQTQGGKILKVFVSIYATLFRGTPMLIQIVFFSLLLSRVYDISAFSTALLAIGLNSAAYVSQIIKSGINSVSKGQIEAAKTLGLDQYDRIRYIILPQALRTVIPALTNEFITLIKDTSLASTIGVAELFYKSKIIVSHTIDPIPIYLIVAGIYLSITTTLSIIIHYIEKKFDIVKS